MKAIDLVCDILDRYGYTKISFSTLVLGSEIEKTYYVTERSSIQSAGIQIYKLCGLNHRSVLTMNVLGTTVKFIGVDHIDLPTIDLAEPGSLEQLEEIISSVQPQ